MELYRRRKTHSRKAGRSVSATGVILKTRLVCRRLLLIWLAAIVARPVPVSAQTDSLSEARAAEARRVDVIAKAMPATIGVFSTDGGGGGSGVVVSADGYALTNWHVVEPCGAAMYCSMPDGRVYDAVLVGIDPVGDVALIKLQGRGDFPVAVFADSDKVNVGDFCFAVGNPFLLASNFQPSVSWGIVSGVHRYQYPSGTLLEYADCIQTDAAINPGNSGGGLFNGRSELIGINGRGSFEKRGRVNVGIGYAISINQIKYFLGQLKSGLIVDHATLGATVVASRQGRVVVQDILTGSDAWRRGLRYGDEFVSLGGRQIASVNEFKNVLGTFPADWRVPIEYRRDDEQFRIVVRLASVHSREKLLDIVQRGPEDPEAEPQPDGDPEKQPKLEPGIEKPLSKRAQTIVDKYFEQRDGFANYQFNRLQTESVWGAFREQAQMTSVNGKFRLSGHDEDGLSVQIVLDDENSGLQLGAAAHVLTVESELAKQLEPAGSGGLLAAMHLWRRILVRGPAGSGDVYSFGRLPDWNGELRDVLVCNSDGVQVRYFFNPQTRLLTALEFWSSSDVDPCEIQLDDYRQVNQVQMPHRLTVIGEEGFRKVLQIDTCTIGESP